MAESVFSKIINGEIPCEKIYEDEKTLAFLDIHPLTPGHVLVIPKNQVDTFYELPDDDYEALWQTVKKVSNRIMNVAKPKRVCVRAEGFDVSHAHIHVYPCNNANDFYGDKDRLNKEPDHSALAEMAKKLAF